MPEKNDKAKISDRDATLIKVLERMGNQIERQDKLLEDIIRSQNEFSRVVKRTEFSRSSSQGEADAAIEKLNESFSRYRSDMFNLAREQDNMTKGMEDMLKKTSKMAYTLASADQNIADLDERFKKQEKSLHDHYEHSLKQAEMIPKEIADAGRDLAKLHAGTEKSIEKMHGDTQNQLESFKKLHAETEKSVEKMHGDTQLKLENFTKIHGDTEKSIERMHGETQRQLERMQKESMQRLLAFDSIESALQTILIRTEPPEKKPLLIVRVFKKIGRFFGVILPRAFRRFFTKWEDM